MKRGEKKEGLIAIVPFLYVMISILLVYIVSRNGVYPTGSDTMYHIYRGNYLYHEIAEKNFAPVLNLSWYNGVQLLRYWAPLSAYFLAMCQFFASGDPLDGYLIFVGLIFLLGALSWLYVGKKVQRPWLGAFIGIIWFFMPNNLLALFIEGNLARSVCMIFLPLFFHACYQYCLAGEKKYLWMIVITFACMTLCHVGYAGMIAFSMLIFAFMFRVVMKLNRRKILDMIVGVLLGFGVTGLYLVPSLIGGITSLDASESMKSFFQPILTTLNPMDRMTNGYVHFYFGLAACILAIVGLFFSKRICIPGFAAALILLNCTTSAMYQVVKFLPGSQYLWMLRFISISLCMILYTFLLWDRLKKGWLIFFCILLVADTVPSLEQVYGNTSGQLVEERLNDIMEGTLLNKAQEMTDQRLAVMDLSGLGSMGAYLSCTWDKPVDITFGAGWEAAVTSSNIMQLNRALENGYYLYLFDRAMELGNDSVLVMLNCIDEYKGSIEQLDEAALKTGYQLMEKNDRFRLYHIETPMHWGTKTKYEGIAIGSGATQITLAFPSIKEGDDLYLDNYTFDELKDYKIIYLSGFKYYIKEDAEKLVKDLSQAGVRVVVLADGVPEDRKLHAQLFLGVNCNAIEFANGYPELITIDGILNTDLFPKDYAKWETVYVDGLDEVWGYTDDDGFYVPFYGTVENDNIVFIGLDLTRFYGLTLDPSVEKLLSHALNVTNKQLPERKIIPIDIVCHKNMIDITCAEDEVNIAIAYHDIFRSEQEIKKEHNLTVVNAGKTQIRLIRPYVFQGFFVTLFSTVLTIIYINICSVNHKKSKTES